MKQLLIDGIIHCSWTGPTPDWAKDAERRATEGAAGYVLRTVAHGDYAEGERADEWDETTGQRKVERPVKTPEQLDAEAFDTNPAAWAESRCDQIDAELVRRLKAGFAYQGAMVPLDIGAQTAFLSQSDAIRDGVLPAGLVRTGDNRDVMIPAAEWGAFKLAALQAGTALNMAAWAAKEAVRTGKYEERRKAAESYFGINTTAEAATEDRYAGKDQS